MFATSNANGSLLGKYPIVAAVVVIVGVITYLNEIVLDLKIKHLIDYLVVILRKKIKYMFFLNKVFLDEPL